MSWDVVSMLSEPEPLVLAFVASCRAAGAKRVHVFLDMPAPAIAARLGAIEGCVVTRCDDAFWRDLPGGRSYVQSGRQKAIAQYAYDRTTADWLLHIDADEYLCATADGQAGLADTVDAALTAVPARATWAFVQAVERVHLASPDASFIFEGAFRRAAPPHLQAQIDAIDGPAAGFLRQGVAAYVGGKSFLRTGCGLKPDIHAPNPPDPTRQHRIDSLALLHFDALTPRNWSRKKRRTMAQQPGWAHALLPHRKAQFQAVKDAKGNEAALRAHYETIKVLSPERAGGLRRLGLLLDVRFDPRPALAAHMPGPAPDLSAAAFDAVDILYRRNRDPRAVFGGLYRPLSRVWRRWKGR